MKRIFIAATGQNQGKTTVSLGLTQAIIERGLPVGFIKPVGQRYADIDGEQIDEDAVLLARTCGIRDNIKKMSPVVIAKGFTRDYIDSGDNDALRGQITEAFDTISDNKELMLIEGTGHAGVGSVIGLSNAVVAKLLDSKVIIVSGGGIGKPVDEIALNACLFRHHGVEVLGALLNKNTPDKLDVVNDYTRRALERLGVPLLGAIPLEPVLGGPTMRQVRDEIGADLINGETELDNHVDRIELGAMTVHHAMNFFGPNTLVITPGDRGDLILAAISSALTGVGPGGRVSGLVLTGGIRPHDNIMKIIRSTALPVLAVGHNSYDTASRIHDITIKIHPNDARKIKLVHDLIRQYVDVDRVFDGL